MLTPPHRAGCRLTTRPRDPELSIDRHARFAVPGIVARLAAGGVIALAGLLAPGGLPGAVASAAAVPATVVAASVVGSVRWTTTAVNVRGHPTTASPPLFVLPAGTAVRVVRLATDSAHRTWYLVRVHSRLGWLASWLTRGATATKPSTPAPTWNTARVTSFGVGDGLVGSSMACGGHLATTTMGVAHRTLACGTRLRLRLGSRVVEAEVVDRGPFTEGLTFDLAPGACRALGACYGITTIEWQLVQ